MIEPGKAIPTDYNGIRMRSRFEANLAFELDRFHIEWLYEPQGFHLGAAGHYLPDFHLPALHSWIECRGYDGRDEQLDAFALRCARMSERFAVVRSNSPATIVGEWSLRGPVSRHARGQETAWDPCGLRNCSRCAAWFIDCETDEHECAACGHVGSVNGVLPLSADRGKIVTGLWACMSPDLAVAWATQPIDPIAVLDWADECAEARRLGKPVPMMPPDVIVGGMQEAAE